MTDIETAVVRTVVPYVVGFLASLGAIKGLGVSNADLTALITLVVGALYHAGASWLEKHVDPRFGWLLGSASAPIYVPKHVA